MLLSLIVGPCCFPSHQQKHNTHTSTYTAYNYHLFCLKPTDTQTVNVCTHLTPDAFSTFQLLVSLFVCDLLTEKLLQQAVHEEVCVCVCVCVYVCHDPPGQLQLPQSHNSNSSPMTCQNNTMVLLDLTWSIPPLLTHYYCTCICKPAHYIHPEL